MKALKLISILFIIFLSILYGFLNTIDYANLVADGIKSRINLYVDPSKIRVHIFPIPVAYVEDLDINDDIYIKETEIHMSVLGLMGIRKSPIESIICNDATNTVHYDTSLVSVLDNLKSQSELFSVVSDVKFNNVTVVNVNFNSTIRIITANIGKSGIFAQLENGVRIDCVQKDQDNLKISLTSSVFSINMNAFYENSLVSKIEFSGTVQDLISLIMPIYGHLETHYEKSQDAQLAISGTIQRDQEKIWSDLISLKSELTDAEAKFTIYSDKSQISRAELRLAKGDIKQISKEYVNYRFDLRDMNLEFKVTADAVQIHSNAISNILCSGKITDGTVHFDNFSGNINTDGVFNFTGEIEKNRNNYYVLKGRLEAHHPDINAIINDLNLEEYAIQEASPLTLTSNIIYSNIDTVLTDLFLKYNDISANGNVSVKLIGKEPRINASLAITNLDLSTKKYPIISNLHGYIEDLMQNFGGSDYVSKFVRIRNIRHIGTYQLEFLNPKFSDKIKMDDIILLSNINKNVVNVSSFYGKVDKNYVTGNFSIDAESLKPNMVLNVENMGLSDFDFLETIRYTERKLNEVDMSSFFAKVTLHSDKISDKTFGDVSNLYVELDNDSNLINVNKFIGNISDTRFNIQGGFTVKPFKLNVYYYAEGVPIITVNKFLNGIAPVIDGTLNLAGKIETRGVDLNEIAYYAESDGNFSGRDIRVASMDIDTLVEDLRLQDYTDDTLSERIFNAGHNGITSIDTIVGKYKLTKGLLNFNDIVFNTKNTAGNANANINIYSQDLNIKSDINFYLMAVQQNQKPTPFSLTFKASGKLFDVDKYIEPSQDLISAISERISQKQNVKSN